MPIIVACDCGKTFWARDVEIGRTARCPSCRQIQAVPAPGELAGEELVVIGPVGTRISRNAISSLILGLSSFGCSILTGVPAIFLGLEAKREIDRSGGLITGRRMANAGIITGILSSLLLGVALLLPAISGPGEAARRAQCTNNLKQIGLALYNYHETWGCFPPAAIRDAEGKALLSWRVAILPYIEQSELYSEFHLDEPWDSPHNASLLQKMPRSYACPTFSFNKERTTTTYAVLIGPGTVFENPAGTRVADITDGTLNTISVVEAKEPIPWTMPEDLPYHPLGSLSQIGSEHPGGFNALFADGSIHFVKKTLAERTLRALITRNGGERVNVEEY